MSTDQFSSPLKETSPSVQAHLGVVQSVIERMAGNSTSSKSWCITIVSAVLVLVADKGKPDFAFIALIPTFLFFVLDAYYLGLEKVFRVAYSDFVRKLLSGKATAEDLCAAIPKGGVTKHRIRAFTSLSVWGFYGTIVILIELTRSLILK